jgi:hypothetical protein
MTGLVLTVLLQGASVASAQTVSPPVVDRPAAFVVGEHLRYAVKIGMLRVGTATMSVVDMETVRGVESYHFVFTLEGGVLGYRVHDRVEAWTGRDDLVTRRSYKKIEEGDFRAEELLEIFPDSGHYIVNGGERKPSPPDPLDETSFFYYMRSVPLEVGQTYVYHRYYKAEDNPLTIAVTKRERVKLPDGSKVESLRLEPVMGDHELLARRVRAQVWLTDDQRRLPARIRLKTPYGTLTLQLEAIEHVDQGAPAG